MKGNRAALLAGALISVAACVHSDFHPTTDLKLPARPEGCYLDMVFQGEPPDRYIVIGQVTTDSTASGLAALGESNGVAIQRLKDEACSVGAHGLMHVDAASGGTWNGDGYSKSTTGGAVAFVYVDEAGRPLPPPDHPKLVIHQGSAASATPAPAPAPAHAQQ